MYTTALHKYDANHRLRCHRVNESTNLRGGKFRGWQHLTSLCTHGNRLPYQVICLLLCLLSHSKK